MVRVIGLLIALMITTGAIGFYLGRESVAPTKAAPEKQAERTRARDITPTTRISLPIAGLTRKEITDTFSQARGSERRHDAQDILAPRGTPVLAVDDGVVKKLFLSKPGGITLYQFDPTERYCYYYAHLDHYAEGIIEGMQLRRGQVLGYVGTTGNANPDTPHLHFAINELGPEKEWWKGTPLNPYPLLLEAFEARR